MHIESLNSKYIEIIPNLIYKFHLFKNKYIQNNVLTNNKLLYLNLKFKKNLNKQIK